MKPVDPRILTINGGSSSTKFALFEAGDSLRRILEGGVERVSWGMAQVFVPLTRETIQQSPEYAEESLLTRDYEMTALHRYYCRQGYRVDDESSIPVEANPRECLTCVTARPRNAGRAEAEAVALFCYQARKWIGALRRRWADRTRWCSRVASARMRPRFAPGFVTGWNFLGSNSRKSETRRLRAEQRRNSKNERTATMLTKAKTLEGYTLDSRDGEIGTVKEFYFDDRYWAIRYLVADTGNWLTGRQVLIAPYALGAASKEEQHIVIDLTKKQIEDSPALNSDKPVSKQFEHAYYGYYGWPNYWQGPYMWGSYSDIVRDPEKWRGSTPAAKAWDPNLRSTETVSGYQVHAADGEIGHVEDFIIDDDTWVIRYLIIDTRNWWSGKKVLIAPQWIKRVSWYARKVFVPLTRETIQQSPEYTEESLLTRDYETALHRHYNREGYWVDDEPAAKERSR